MLSIAVNRELMSLIQETYALLDCVQGDVSEEEVGLRVGNINRVLKQLQSALGIEPNAAVNSMVRHLHWLQRRHAEGRPDLFAPDIADIRDRDLPGVVSAVETRGRQLFDPGLVAAVIASWEAQNFESAVRDAFIYLEHVLRKVAEIDSGSGLSGDRLVTSLLSQSGPQALVLSTEGDIAQLTTGEREGVYYFFKGAFLLFRNATAHRRLPYSATETEAILHVVDICLRLLKDAVPK